MAINKNGILLHQVYNQNINERIFIDFIIKLSKKVSNQKFLMDNVSFHKTNKIKNFMNKTSNELLFIPPYSPELNPIEEFFSALKNKIKKSNSCSNLMKINNCIDHFKYNNFEKYYKHSFQ